MHMSLHLLSCLLLIYSMTFGLGVIDEVGPNMHRRCCTVLNALRPLWEIFLACFYRSDTFITILKKNARNIKKI